MKKIIGVIAMAVALGACNKNKMDFQRSQQSSDEADGITIIATLAPKTTKSKAVKEDVNTIISTWATTEHVAILYEVNGVKKVSDATITAVDENGVATISFTVDGSTPDNTPCTLIYPLKAAKSDNSGVKDAADLLAAQDGTLSTNLDVRVGEGSLQTTNPCLIVTTQPAAQYAIFKLSVCESDGATPISVKPLVISFASQDYTIVPTTATDELYVALPAVSSQKIDFDATNNAGKNYICSFADVTFSAGKYYQSTLKMREYVLMGEGYGLKWATCNVGADNPQDYGDYFAWGELAPYYEEGHAQDNPCSNWKETKTGYNLASYFDSSDGNYNFIKYAIEKKTVLEPEDDAARQNWGGFWRIPTEAEWIALTDKTKFTWEMTDNYNETGVKGEIITSKVSGYTGNSIFLPATGGRRNSEFFNAGSYGYYWSSSLGKSSTNSMFMFFYSKGPFTNWTWPRNYGLALRPVAD